MMLKRAILIVLFPFIVFADPSDTLGKSSCELALDAHSRRESNQNWIFSPFSASACLSMVFTGAAGPTAEELSRALHLDGILEVPQTYRDLQNSLIHSTSKANDFTLHIAQGMWKADGFPFLSSFVSSMQNDFGAQIETIDFDSNATHRINSWFAEETHQKIQNLLQPSDIDPNTKLVLGNAIYFCDTWVQPFSADRTSPEPFYLYPEVAKTVPMMRQAAKLPYYEDEELQAVLLPLSSASVSCKPACLLVLGKNDTRRTVISPQKLDRIFSFISFRMVNLAVPKFKMERRFDLENLLRGLGVSLAFSRDADFSLMDGSRDLCISKIVQKSFFSLNEDGVEAAAGTAAVMNLTCQKPPPDFLATFTADRPFDFLLIDEISKVCLMIGHVADPE